MKKVHLIGNAHIDPAWLWRWQDGFSEILATFRSALDRMNDFPDFKFTSACASYYKWIEKIEPKMFSEIQSRVKEGRWSIVGGWVLQPDCNIPMGESFARHGLTSQRYFKEKFGITAKTGYNVDSFGHNAALPKILKASGMDNYVFMRPMHYEKDIDKSLFVWESDDGSRVKVFRIIESYNINLDNLELISQIKEKAEKDNLDYMAFYGVGNHGGGPTIKLIDQINKFDIEGLVYSTPDEYFNSVSTDGLDVLKEDLQHHARGCYSACSFVKKQNRMCERNLLAAEKLAVMAKELVGAEYPGDELNKAWANVLFNQFHDVLGGCSIKKVYEDAGYLYGEAMSITDRIINEAMQKIAWNIDTLQGETLPAHKTRESFTIWEHEVLGTPVVVFNPHAWQVTMPVSIYSKLKKVTDAEGNEIPFQLVRGDQTNTNDKHHTAFNATVEPYGYAVYRIFREKECTAVFPNTLTVTERSLENNKIKVVFDDVTGDISSFYDKEKGQYIINKSCSAILLDEEDCDTWAHGKVQLGSVAGSFGSPEFEITASGNVKAALKVTTTYNTSTLTREYSIIPDSKEVRVKSKVSFNEKFRTLKLSFPLQGDKIISQIPYGTIAKPLYTGEEACGAWISDGIMCIANDSKHGYDTEDNNVRLSILRSAIYADHYGKDDRDSLCEFMDLGISEFQYSVYPYENNAQADKKAEELNLGLLHINGCFHNGTLPEKNSFIEVSDPSVIVSAIKEKEDGSENIVRFFEANGQNTNVTVKLFDKTVRSEILHNQVKTFTENGKEINLIEE